jgi:hypothetical protein
VGGQAAGPRIDPLKFSTPSRAIDFKMLIFTKQPTSNGCILAGITDKHKFTFYTIGFPESGWTIPRFYGADSFMDIAFCNGELYGITRCVRKLSKFKFGVDSKGSPMLMNIHWLCMLNHHWENPDEHARYLVELHGKLLTVGSNHNWWSRHLRKACGPRFTVHELLVDDGHVDMKNRNVAKYRWMEVTSLGEHSLFLGPTCSKAVRVRRCAEKPYLFLPPSMLETKLRDT